MSALFGRLFMRLKYHLLSICLLILHLGSKNQSKKEEIFGREPSSICCLKFDWYTHVNSLLVYRVQNKTITVIWLFIK